MYQPIRLYGLTGEPTQAQVKYAESICSLLGLSLPAEKTKQAYSDFINKNVRKYKEGMRNDIQEITG